MKKIKGIKDCALVSPYLQQDPPGGYLSSVIAKHHHEAIFKFVFANDFVFSYSRSRICVYRFDRVESRLVFLFDVELPNTHKLRDFLSLPILVKCQIRNYKRLFYKHIQVTTNLKELHL